MLNSNAFLNMHFGGHCAGFSLQLTLAEYKLLETSRSHTRRLLKVSSLVRLTKENHKCKSILWLWPPMDMCRVETNNTAMCFHIYIYIAFIGSEYPHLHNCSREINKSHTFKNNSNGFNLYIHLFLPAKSCWCIDNGDDGCFKKLEWMVLKYCSKNKSNPFGGILQLLNTANDRIQMKEVTRVGMTLNQIQTDQWFSFTPFPTSSKWFFQTPGTNTACLRPFYLTM